MSPQTVTMEGLAAMFAAAFLEHALNPVRIFGAVVSLMFQKPTAREVAAAECALGVLGRQHPHFLACGVSEVE